MASNNSTPNPTATTAPNTSPDNVQPKRPSNNAVAKDAGFRSDYHLYQSYGIKDLADQDQLAEGKAIIEGLRRQNFEGKESGIVVEPKSDWPTSSPGGGQGSN